MMLIRIAAAAFLVTVSFLASALRPEFAATLPAPGQEDVQVGNGSRGYLTTPAELETIARKAARGIEPYQSAVSEVLAWANKDWNYRLAANTDCLGADDPSWIDDQGGVPRLYARALAYHLTEEERYAAEAAAILEQIMTTVQVISIKEQQCRLNFSWGTPELVASADLLETYWQNRTCSGPESTQYGENQLTTGPCKRLFQNWLVKNPYYVMSYSAERSQSNWGAAATNATAYIADYLWDRKDVLLVTRLDNTSFSLTPHLAFARARKLALDRMNGYRVEHDSSRSCDYLSGQQQAVGQPPVKSQITEEGIIPEDARRDEHCNVTVYDGTYQNYPQVYLGNTIQQCELLLRRGDSSCYDNVSQTEVQRYWFFDPKGELQWTTLRKGRGSIERAIKAIIVDSQTEWRHDSALEVAYRYYYTQHMLPGFEQWYAQLDPRPANCSQDICFGTLTHGFALSETPAAPPIVRPPY